MGKDSLKARLTLVSTLLLGVGSVGCAQAGGETGAAKLRSAQEVSAPALDDGAILAIYNQVNSFDIEIGLLAVNRGHSEEVRALGSMVSNDHSGVRGMASDLATELNLDLSLPAARSQAAADHYAVLAKLMKLEGAAFDQAYLQHEISFHESAIQAIRTLLLPSSTSSKVIEHFNAVLPAFEHHLSKTREVAQNLGMSSTGQQQ